MNFNLANYKVKPLIGVILGISAITSLLLSLLKTYGILVGISTTGVAMGFLWWYDSILWKKPFFNLLCTVPDLNGDYLGEVSYCWNGENTRKNCELRIVQTCSYISVKSRFFKEGENTTWSKNLETSFSTDAVGQQQIVFRYQNDGSRVSGDTLNQHDGLNILDVSKCEDGFELSGYYFTNRDPQTKGNMIVKEKPVKEQNENA